MILLYFLLSVSLAEPDSLPAHRLAVTDGGTLTLPEITIAVVGNTRPASAMLDKARAVDGSYASALIGDIIVQSLTNSLDFVVHTGDMVPVSSPNAWKDFGVQFASLIDGSTPSGSAAKRHPIIPVAGDRDCAKEPTCHSLGKSFPGFGVDIGFGRTATWQAFELHTGSQERWKLIVLDTNKKGLGSRWNEQLLWLTQQAQDPKSGIVLFMHEPAATLAEGRATAYARELVEHIENNAPLMSVRAIFSAGPSFSQALLPEGAFGTAHFGSGGGGAPAHDLHRGMSGDAIDSQLAPGFNEALDTLIRAYEAHPSPPSRRMIDEALGRDSFKGFGRRIDGAAIPTHGWWKLLVSNQGLSVEWRVRQPDGTFKQQATWQWRSGTGWTSSGVLKP